MNKNGLGHYKLFRRTAGWVYNYDSTDQLKMMCALLVRVLVIF